MKIEITTEDGTCPVYEYRPAGEGRWPGVLMFMDGIGMRPALLEMAERLATSGYHVLLPDLLYRAGPYEAPDPKALFSDPEVRNAWFKKVFGTTNIANTMRDTRAFLAHLAARPSVVQPKVGAVGYCMGGRMALAAAAHYPDRIAAIAAYHPGSLADDKPDSPHLIAGQIKGRVYVAAASDDASFPDEQKQRLEQALASAGVAHVIETYPARHGWVPSDTPVHDAACTERHWQTLLDLFDSALPRA